MLLMWSVWIIVGTAYYASPGGMNLGFCKGFFKAVDVGYSIGWGYPAEETNGQMIFSVIYCIIGASFVAMALGFFADSVIEDSQSWFDNLQEKAEYEAVMQQGTLYYKTKEYLKFHWLKVRIVLLWFIWLLFGIIFVAATHQDNFAEGLIFSVTSMSTGGLRGLPTDAPDWEWFVVGAFAATGVPLMGLAMGTIAQALMDHDSLEDVEGVLNMPVDAEELENMQNFGFDDDGLISLQEYIILSTVRLGLVDPQAIELMALKYATFDADGDGQVTYKEIIDDAHHVELDSSHIRKVKHELIDVELGENMNEYGFYVEDDAAEANDETEDEKIRRLVKEEREREKEMEKESEEKERIRRLISEERKKQETDEKRVAKEIVSEEIRREREVEIELAREKFREMELAKEREKAMFAARDSQKERERLRERQLSEQMALARQFSGASPGSARKSSPSKSKSPSRRVRRDESETSGYDSGSTVEIPAKPMNKAKISPKLNEELTPLKHTPLRSSEDSARELANAEAEFNASLEKFLPQGDTPGSFGSPSKSSSTQRSRVKIDDDGPTGGRKDRISPVTFSPEGKKKALPPLTGPGLISKK